MTRRLPASALASVFVLSGCAGSDAEGSASATATATATVTVTVTSSPESSPAEEPTQGGALRLGETADVGFARITALQVDPDVPVDNFPSQERWAAVLVRTCATVDETDGEPIEVGWGPWTVGDRDDGIYQITGVTGGVVYPLPTYPLDPPQRLVRGQCVKGWIPFNVAPSARLASVTYASERADQPATWRF